MKMDKIEILRSLPYGRPFLFVDSLEEITELGVRGSHTYAEDSDFYRGHFKDNPVTPGVILTETMAQIGVVCLGIFLLGDQIKQGFPNIALTSSAVDFFIPVFPGERVEVVGERIDLVARSSSVLGGARCRVTSVGPTRIALQVPPRASSGRFQVQWPPAPPSKRNLVYPDTPLVHCGNPHG